MITIIHGTDTLSSRKYYIDLKLQTPDAVQFDGETITLTAVTQALSGGSLFSDEKSIFIDQFFTKKKKQGHAHEAILEFLKNTGGQSSIYIWEDKELEKKLQFSLKDASFKAFSFPKIIFTFLDTLKPGNGVKSLSLFHELLQTTDTEMIFFMLVRQFRILIAFSDSNSASIDETKRLADWQKGKILNQAKLFGKEKLISCYRKLYAIDKAQKTGTATLPLDSAIDIFLLET